MDLPADTTSRSLVMLMTAAGVVLAAALGLIVVARRRRKTPEELERLRRLDVNRRGRITQGQIVDLLEPAPGKIGARLVVFKYEVSGVTYETAQDIASLPNILAHVKQATGQLVRLKYAVERPTNSILACEEWSGVPEFSKIKAQVKNVGAVNPNLTK